MQLKCHFCRIELDDGGEYASWIETVRVEPGRRTEVRTDLGDANDNSARVARDTPANLHRRDNRPYGSEPRLREPYLIESPIQGIDSAVHF